MYNMYYQNGVIVTPNVVVEGDMVSVNYQGILYNSGADQVYMRVGYGDKWKENQDIKMERTGEGFRTEIPVRTHEQLKLCFKDSAGNWDNNSSRNYAFEVQHRL